MKNIFLLPTPKPSRLYKNGNFLLLDSKEMPDNTLETKNQHLSVTSDEEIKEGSYVIKNGQVFKVDSNNAYSGTFNITLKYAKKYLKKIILTTDPDLIKDGVQAIPDEFLEWFVKNPSCEYVEVVPLRKSSGYYDKKEIWHWDFLAYKIIIPKEEPKQESLSWNELVREAGSEEELIKILKLPHIAPLVREAMRNNCKK